MAIEKDFFRQVVGRFATGDTVVATRSHGRLAGQTANAFCSVSLTPPLILICIDLTSATCQVLQENGTEKAPLVYYLRQYRHLSSSYQKPSLATLATYIHCREAEEPIEGQG